MTARDKKRLQADSPYTAAITREQFLFYEVRTTARLLCEGLSREEIVNRIVAENLFQYPTERSVRKMAYACLRRLDSLGDDSLIDAISSQSSDVSKQICLYAMMKQYRLIWDFMITVVGAKYQSMDMSFSKSEFRAFLLRLQEQDDYVATWSESTVKKICQVLARILVENEYLDSPTGTQLHPVLICSVLENAIRSSNDDIALAAFNCLE